MTGQAEEFDQQWLRVVGMVAVNPIAHRPAPLARDGARDALGNFVRPSLLRVVLAPCRPACLELLAGLRFRHAAWTAKNSPGLRFRHALLLALSLSRFLARHALEYALTFSGLRARHPARYALRFSAAVLRFRDFGLSLHGDEFRVSDWRWDFGLCLRRCPDACSREGVLVGPAVRPRRAFFGHGDASRRNRPVVGSRSRGPGLDLRPQALDEQTFHFIGRNDLRLSDDDRSGRASGHRAAHRLAGNAEQAAGVGKPVAGDLERFWLRPGPSSDT